MIEWLESIAGREYVPAILWTLAALAAFVVILIIIRVVRRMSAGTFVAGGRSRKTRLAVMDATAVDSHRRLILVRRDDVEHLLLIGGPTDIVVEQNIRLLAPQRRPGDPNAPGQPRPRPAEAAQPQAPVPPAPQRPTTLPPPSPPRPTPPPSTQRLREPVSEIRPPVAPSPRPLPPVVAPARPPAPVQDDIDDTLMHELEATLDNASAQAVPAKTTEQSLEEEMAKLLGELSTPKK